MNTQAIDKWHKTKIGYLVFGVIELLLVYPLASLAIDQGRFWQYVLAFIFLFGGLRNLIRIFWTPNNEHGKH